MGRILNYSEQIDDQDMEQLMTTLLFYFVERSGGEVNFTLADARQTVSDLTKKMLQLHMGDEIRLRVITRPAELQEIGDSAEDL